MTEEKAPAYNARNRKTLAYNDRRKALAWNDTMGSGACII
jgi:hypothetical protein